MVDGLHQLGGIVEALDDLLRPVVDDLDLDPLLDHCGDLIQGHIPALDGVVELAVRVALDDSAGRTLVSHGALLNDSKIITHRANTPQRGTMKAWGLTSLSAA